MPTTTVEWQWAVDAENVTRAGVVAAVRTASGVTVHAVLPRTRLSRVNCSMDGRDWVLASQVTAIPEADFDRQSFGERYNRKWPAGRGAIDAEKYSLTGVRFVCAFDDLSSSVASERRLTVRSADGWRIDGVRIRCPGYPIVDEAATGSGAASQCPAVPLASAASNSLSARRADVTVCVQYIYGSGYSARTVREFAAWYLLLGAKRIVVFDSMEPHLEPALAPQRVAQERMDFLHDLSSSLGSRFVVVRGLAVWDMMRRTRLHMSGQSLAGAMCKAAAGALAVPGRPTFALMPDFDELLSPPTADASAMPHRLATRLAGSLRRLALHVHSGVPVTAHYLPEDSNAVTSRVHYGGGTRRCLSFASVYYLTPACNHSHRSEVGEVGAAGERSGDDSAAAFDAQPALLRRSWRAQPDNFEQGPSYAWKHFAHWNFFVRSKYLVDATDDAIMTGNHECCCHMSARAGGQCTTRNGLIGNHTCAALEFMPLEHWHVRHLRGGGLSEGRDACRRSSSVPSIECGADGVRRHVRIEPTAELFPTSWAAEYLAALDNLTRSVA